MHRIICTLALTILPFLNAHELGINEEGSNFPSQEQKCYIAFDQLRIIPGGLFISLDANTTLSVNEMHLDNQGFYYLEEEGVSWICQWCGALNPLSNSSCQRCSESYGTSPA